jgi:aspartyl protease family protein
MATVLLGMSALNKLEFTQRGGTMLLRQTTK